MCELFTRHCPTDDCFAIDVNHGQWRFIPSELRLTSHFEPFPVSVVPWAEYVVFANSSFSSGLFCNPRNQHIVVFGQAFVDRFTEDYRDRLTNVRVASQRIDHGVSLECAEQTDEREPD